MNFGEKLRAAREAAGLTQQQIASVMGIDKSTYCGYETGKRQPNVQKIKLLSQILKIGADNLLDTGYIMPSNLQPMFSTHKVPRLGTIACGTPILAVENIECYDNIPDYVKADFTLVCKGDSMINARIFAGDIVCIRKQPEVVNGEIAAVLIDDEATLKRVRLYSDHISLEPENPQYRPLVYWGEEMETVHIIGKATHFISALG